MQMKTIERIGFLSLSFKWVNLVICINSLKRGFSFFLISLMLFSWISYIKKNTFLNLIGLLLVNSFCFFTYSYIRPEFVLTPFALLLCFLVSIVLVGPERNPFYFKGLKTIALGVFLISLFAIWQSDLINFVDSAYQAYIILNQTLQSSSSLGTTLIVEAPIPIRLILGSIYLYVFPIPFWAELQINSLYHIFKFLNLIYFYFFVPLVILSIFYFFKLKRNRSLINYFLLFSIIGFTASIALTSLETRHLGQFLPFLMLFSLIPPLENKVEYLNYFKIFLFIYHQS